MFQSGPEPEFVVASRRLADGRTVAVFLHDDKQDADLVVTEDHGRPEIWGRVATGTRDEMLAQLWQFVAAHADRV